MAMILMMGSLVLTSCDDDDDEETPPPATNQVTIVTDTLRWSNDQIQNINGRLVIEDGGVLEIEEGTIIKAAAGQGTQASVVVVARGGKIMADGTATMPIIFTSSADNIQLGETAGTNLEKTDNQTWGGVIILGNAPISAEDGNDMTNIEGIPVEAGYGEYGGTDENDDSGILDYVSIRHGGISIGEGNEINGLTLGGVGNGTTVTNVEVYATLDDGIECFGGSVNINNALVYYQGDDGIDLDMSYSGTISNFAVIHGDGIGTDESLEIDGPENDANPDGKFTLNDGVCIVEGADGSAADLKSGAQGTVMNVTFTSGDKEVKFRTRFIGSETNMDCEHRSDAYTNLIANPADLVFIETSMTGGIEVYDGDEDDENPTVCPTSLTDAQQTAEGIIPTAGLGSTIDPATLFSWTLAGERGEL
ncbi:MAG: hypothetical protein MK086_01215 [Flavobacteriales bacterium]|nr:hypothetical protein [Flavobacteriales bacterium]